MTSVIYPGTFDPITNGHLDIIERSAVIFPRVLVAVANSPSKSHYFLWRNAWSLFVNLLHIYPMWRCLAFSDLLANVIKQHNISAIIRGVRTTTDFEYELQLAALNRLLTKGVDSLFFPPAEKWAFVSSTIVREIYLHGGDVAELVPEPVFNALKAR